jgi:hypothetical protein
MGEFLERYRSISQLSEMIVAEADAEIERLQKVEELCKAVYMDWCNADQAANAHTSLHHIAQILGFQLSDKVKQKGMEK